MDKYFIIYEIPYEGAFFKECSTVDECENELSNCSIHNQIIRKVIHGKEVTFKPKEIVTRYEIED